MQRDDEEYFEVSVLEVEDIDSFIEWIKYQSLQIALQQVGSLFFEDPDKYKDKWETVDQNDLSDNYVFEEMFPFLFFEEDDDKTFITSKDAQKLISNISNYLIYIFLNHLVDEGILEMCWNVEREDFMWRIALK